MTSEAIHRFGSGTPKLTGSPRPPWFPIQSGDSEDLVAAVQNLAELSGPLSSIGPHD